MRSKMTKSLTGGQLHLNDFTKHLVVSFSSPFLFIELIQSIIFNAINNYVNNVHCIIFCLFFRKKKI